MKFVFVTLFALSVSACSLQLGAEKLNVDAQTAHNSPLVYNAVIAERGDIAYVPKVYA